MSEPPVPSNPGSLIHMGLESPGKQPRPPPTRGGLRELEGPALGVRAGGRSPGHLDLERNREERTNSSGRSPPRPSTGGLVLRCCP